MSGSDSKLYLCVYGKRAESSSEIIRRPFFLHRSICVCVSVSGPPMIANEWLVAYLTNQAFKATANNETVQNMTAQNVNIQYENRIVTQQTPAKILNKFFHPFLPFFPRAHSISGGRVKGGERSKRSKVKRKREREMTDDIVTICFQLYTIPRLRAISSKKLIKYLSSQLRN